MLGVPPSCLSTLRVLKFNDNDLLFSPVEGGLPVLYPFSEKNTSVLPLGKN